MGFNPEKHHRRSIRLKGYDYSKSGFYFVTICTKDRECLFGDIINNKLQLNKLGEIIKIEWFNLKDRYKNIDNNKFIIMPNHIHGIVEIKDINKCRGLINQTPTNKKISTDKNSEWILMKNPKITLGKIIRFFKGKTTRNIRKSLDTYFAWQRNYHDHVIRNEKELKEKKKYIKNNPNNWTEDENNPINIKK